MNDADSKFLKWLEEYENWYALESGKWVWALATCKWALIIGSLASITMGAGLSKEYFDGTGRWLIIGSTILTALSSEVLAQFRVREMEELREHGHIETTALVAYARQRFSEYSDDPLKISALKDELRERITNLDLIQHRQFAALNRTPGQSGAPKKKDGRKQRPVRGRPVEDEAAD